MNIPIMPQCQKCKKQQAITFLLGSGHIEWSCENCGMNNWGFMGNDFTIGDQIWAKASYELTQNKDFSMAVVLSAVAVDSELSFLFKKWTGIQRYVSQQNEFDDEEYAEKMRKLGGIKDKFKAVSELLYPGGIEAYVSSTPKWRTGVDSLPELKSSSLISSLDQTLFWPRNKILHGGGIVAESEATWCVRTARLCLEILLAMDYEKRKTIV